MRPLPKAKHVPSITNDDVGASLRDRAAEATGYRMGQDAFASREELMSRGGPEQVVDRAAARVRRGE